MKTLRAIILVTLLGFSFNANADDLNNVDFGFGKKDDGRTYSVGLKRKKYLHDKFYIQYGGDYKNISVKRRDNLKIVDLEDTRSVRDGSRNESRNDYTIKTGLGFDFDCMSTTLYFGLGQSYLKYRDRSTTYIYDNTKSMVFSNSNSGNKKEFKKEVGVNFKMNIDHNRMEPFINISNISYGNGKSRNSGIMGISFSF